MMKKCNVCGKSYIGDFCPKCGYLDSRDIICSECGKSYDPDLDTCPYCQHTVNTPGGVSEVTLSSYDISRTKPYVKCVNVFTQKVVLSCIAFCLFFALFALVFAGLIYITPKGGMVTYSVLSVVFASFFVAAVILHAAKIIVTRRHGVKKLTDSYRLTSVYVFMGIIGGCFACGCAFLIADAVGFFGKFPFYGFVAYSSVSLAAILYAVYVRTSVRRLRAVLCTSPYLDKYHNIYHGVRFRVAEENLSADVYGHYLAYRRGLRNSKKGAYGSDADDAAAVSTAKAKAYRVVTSKILYVAILSVVIVFVGMFFAIRDGNYLYTSRRIFGGYTLGSETERIEGLLDYDLDRYTKILGTPDIETDDALYWYGDAGEGETCGFVMVTYEDVGGEKKVTSVYLDREHVYSESDLFGTTEKTMEKLSLSQDSFSVHCFETVAVDIASILEDDVAYVAEYNDGSFCVSYLTSFDVASEDHGTYEVEWNDWMGSYSAAVSLTYRSFTNADGVLTSWFVDDGLIDIPDWAISVADDALEGVTNINEVILPEGVTALVIPSSVVRMGEGAFACCSSLESVIVKCISTFASMFSGCDSLVSVDIAYGVEKIADCTFYNLSSLETVTIGGSVTEIGDEAFRGCSSLTGVVIPSSVTSVGDGAFYKCTSLSDVSLPDGLSTISPYMLYSCSSLVSVVIPEGVTSIDVYAFYDCSSLTSVEIQDSVTSISAYAFCECASLATVIIPENVKSIGDFAFYGCTSLADVSNFSSLYIIAGVSDYGYVSYYTDVVYTNEDKSRDFYKASDDFEFYYDGETYSLTGYNGTSEYLTLPESIDGECYEIIDRAFYNNTSVTGVTISDGVTRIGAYAFYGCSSLKGMTIGKNVTTIGNYAFYNCSVLTEICYNAVELADFAGNNYVFYRAGKSGSGITVTIGAGVTKIPADLFYPCNSYYADYSPSITTVVFENNAVCTDIGSDAFMYCSSLISVYITDLAAWCTTDFANYAANPLYYAGNLYLNGELLADVTVPDGVTSVSSLAFYGCTSIENVTIPDFVTSIGANAFYGCSSLEKINYYAEEMDDLSSNGTFASSGASGSGIMVTIGAGVTKIPAYLFYSVSNITTVIFEEGSSCESIGVSAFRGCSGLLSIEIPSGVTTIGNYAFYDCSALTEICYNAVEMSDFAGSNYVFYRAGKSGSGITVTIGAGVTKIPADLFYPCNSYYADYSPRITTVVFENNAVCTDMGSDSFYYCSSLTGVYITDLAAWCTTDFANYAANPLYYAGNLYLNGELLADVTVPDGVTSVSSLAFYGCTSIKTVTVPDFVTSIGANAFYGCSSLEKINYYAEEMDDLSSSGTFASSGASGSGITVTIGAGVTKIPAYLFYSVSNITTVIFEEGSCCESIGVSAFRGCSGLLSIEIPSGVTTIGNYAFYECTALTEICYNAVELSDFAGSNYVFYRAGKSGSGITVTIGAGVTKIPADLFYPCNSYYADYSPRITTVVFENNIGCTDMGSDAFYYCSSLTGVYITDLAAWCTTDFANFTANPLYYAGSLYLNDVLVTKMTLPEGISSVSSLAFYGCTSITSVTVPDFITSIGTNAFYNCINLVNVYNYSTLAIVSGSSDYGYIGYYAKNVDCYYGFEFDYISRSYYLISYSGPDTDLVLPSSVEGNSYRIYEKAFYECTSLTSITISENITAIGGYAFYNCTNLSAIYYNATELNDLSKNNYVFYNAGKNTDGITLTVGANVTKIPAYLFDPRDSSSYAPKITSMLFEDDSQCTTIGTYAFCYCAYLKSITIPENILQIYNSAFSRCTGLVEIYFKATNMSSLYYTAPAFYNAGQSGSGITVTVSSNVVYIPGYLFYSDFYSGYSPNITSVVFEGDSQCECIGERAFWRCSSLKSITIPDSVIYIESYAFWYCTSLTTVTIGSGAKYVMPASFSGCSSLETLIIRSNTMYYIDSFSESSSLKYIYFMGTENKWNEILSLSGVTFKNITVYFYSESEPSTKGNFWYYDEDGTPALW